MWPQALLELEDIPVGMSRQAIGSHSTTYVYDEVSKSPSNVSACDPGTFYSSPGRCGDVYSANVSLASPPPPPPPNEFNAVLLFHFAVHIRMCWVHIWIECEVPYIINTSMLHERFPSLSTGQPSVSVAMQTMCHVFLQAG